MTIADFFNALLAHFAEFFNSLVLQVLQSLFPNPSPTPTQN